MSQLSALAAVALATPFIMPKPALALDNGLGDLPPMGWNSWNLAGCGINESFFRATVDSLASKVGACLAAGAHSIVHQQRWKMASGARQEPTTEYRIGSRGKKASGDPSLLRLRCTYGRTRGNRKSGFT